MKGRVKATIEIKTLAGGGKSRVACPRAGSKKKRYMVFVGFYGEISKGKKLLISRHKKARI